MSRKPVITVNEIDALKARGLTQSDIAREYGVSRAYISWIKHTYGGKTTPREEALKAWPWEVKQEHTGASPYQRLRDHAEYVVTGGKGMSQNKIDRLQTWYEDVENVVVEYDPENKPTPGIKTGGFRYLEREPSDGDMLIRIPEEKMTPEVRAIFSRQARGR